MPGLCVEEGTQKAAHSALFSVQLPWWGAWSTETSSVCCSSLEPSPWPPCSVPSELWAGVQHATPLAYHCQWSQRGVPEMESSHRLHGRCVRCTCRGRKHRAGGRGIEPHPKLGDTQDSWIPIVPKKNTGLGTIVQCKCAMCMGRVQSKQGARLQVSSGSLFLLQTDQPFTICKCSLRLSYTSEHKYREFKNPDASACFI